MRGPRGGARWGAAAQVGHRAAPATYGGEVTEATRTADGAAGPSVDVAAVGAGIAANIGRVVQGKHDVVRLALVVLLAEGHLLIEDVPGVGKTTLAKALAASVDATVRRIQFTPDLLPSDVTGVAVYDQESRAFEFKPGAIFANIVVADEINRASPKTQSALLECMEERQVTVDGVSYELARPFMVMATQNPLEMEGTYPLPEAQRDRFTARVSMGYPDREAELAMLDERSTADPLTTLAPVADAATVRDLVAAVGHAVRLRRRPPLRRRPGRGHPPLPGPAAGRLARGPGCSCCARRARRPPCRDATTCCPTTSSCSPRRSWRTGCSSPPTRPWAGAAPSRSSPSCWPPCRSPAGADPSCRRRLAGSLSTLTVRGRAVVTAAVALLLVGALLGERPARAAGRLRPRAAAAVGAGRGPPALPAQRPAHRRPRPGSRAGRRAEVLLEITNADTRTGGLWVLTEQLPGDLGASPQFVVDRLARGARSAAALPGARPRGAAGTCSARCGCGWSTRSAWSSAAPSGADTATAARRPPGAPAGRRRSGRWPGGGGEGSRRSIAVHGEDDVSTREYRHGDDLRKVHWRATARTGELMVRLEERPWRAQATLLLDTRGRAPTSSPAGPGGDRGPLRPGPAGDDVPPADSLEWLVEAAASIGTDAARGGARCSARSPTPASSSARRPAAAGSAPDDLLDRLAGLGPSRAPAWASGSSSCAAPPATARSSACSARSARRRRRPVRARSGPTTGPGGPAPTSAAWADPAPARAAGRCRRASRGALSAQREDAAALLRAAGWRVAVARADTTVAEVWAALGGPAQAAAALPGLRGATA